ncbi:MAG: hypothetical protein IAG10_01415 [Planctomycetaceae bacterium]|nr:hypothetical protein [Planctomycetaceae bacterium]
MKSLGIVLSVVFGLVALNTVKHAIAGKYNLSTTEGMQQLVGGTAIPIIIMAVGLKLANRKKPPLTVDDDDDL